MARPPSKTRSTLKRGSVTASSWCSGPSQMDVLGGSIGGIFLDLLEKLSLEHKAERGVIKALAAAKERSLLAGQTQQSVQGYSEALAVLGRERIAAAIVEDVTAFQRHSGGAARAAPGKYLFKRCVETVMGLQRQARKLNAEVNAWFLEHHVRSEVRRRKEELKPEESAQKRLDRLQEFWSQFHEASCWAEPCQISPVMSSPKVLPKIDQSGRTTGEMSHRPSLAQQVQRSPPDKWKVRSGRSKYSSGGWDWAQESQLVVRSASAGSLKAGIKVAAARTMHLTSGKLDGNEKELHQKTSKQGLSPIKTKNKPLKALEFGNTMDMSEPLSPPKSMPGTSWPPILRSSSSPDFGRSQNPGKHAPATAPVPRLGKKCSPQLLLPQRGRPDLWIQTDESTAPEAGLPPRPEVPAGFSLPNPLEPPRSPMGRRTASATSLTSASGHYLEACQNAGIVPRAMAFTTGHSATVDARGKAFSNADLESFLVIVRTSGVEELNLEGNTMLTEGALVKLMEVLLERPGGASLRKFSLRGCLHAASLGVMRAMTRLLTDMHGPQRLRHLDLSGIPMTVQNQLPLCQAVREHPALQTLLLADIGLGCGDAAMAKKCLGEILSSNSIVRLDISWSCLTAEVFSHLGERMAEARTLQSLSIANSAAASQRPGDITPVALFLEHLTREDPLKHLDISMNRIDFRGALVVEDALGNSKHLKDLDIGHNPLGVMGLRSVLRLLARSTTGLLHFRCESCATNEAAALSPDRLAFRATSPDGRYPLDLARPYHRAVLRMLYKTCEHFKLSPEEAFQSVTCSPPPFSHPAVGPDGIRRVPLKGSLTATFSVAKAFEKGLQGVGEAEFGLFVQKHLQLARLQPDARKLVPLLAMWKSAEGHLQEQAAILEALAKDFLMPYPCVEMLCRSRSLVPEVLGRLLPCLPGGQPALYLSLLLPSTVGDYVRALRRARSFVTFNIENPTGHYNLDLSNAVDYAVTEQLVLLDSWEAATKRRRELADTSQRGNHSQVRNAKYLEIPLPAELISGWEIPEFGILELDYTSARRPPVGASALDEESFTNILVMLQSADSSPSVHLRSGGPGGHRMQALRLVSHNFCITSLQLRELLGIWLDESARAECLVLLFNRIADMQNEKVFRVRFEKAEEVAQLYNRLGYANYFPFVQPEQAYFHLDFALHDQRLAANLLLNLAAKENRSNLQMPSYKRVDGTVEHMAQVPPTWETFAKMPAEGTFEVVYKCAPEDRKLGVRRQLLETYGNWSMSDGGGGAGDADGGVMWWGALPGVPMDVLNLLEFMTSHFKDVFEAFTRIAGEKKEINQRDFEEGVLAMDCPRFRGTPDVKKRITEVFRYLDPSGGGTISQTEWSILELFWKEIQLSIREFAQFCERRFGADLCETWNVLDEDDSDGITEDEWQKALVKAGYFGPSMPIYRFLDKDGTGNINVEEFQLLRSFQKERMPEPAAFQEDLEQLALRRVSLQHLQGARVELSACWSLEGVGSHGELVAGAAECLGAHLPSEVARALSRHGVQAADIVLSSGRGGVRCIVQINGDASPTGVLETLHGTLDASIGPDEAGVQEAVKQVGADLDSATVTISWPWRRVVEEVRCGPSGGYDLEADKLQELLEPLVSEALQASLQSRLRAAVQEQQWWDKLLKQPSMATFRGVLLTIEEGVHRHLPVDPAVQEPGHLVDVMADAARAHRQLKERLAPGTAWAQAVFGKYTDADEGESSLLARTASRGDLHRRSSLKTLQEEDSKRCWCTGEYDLLPHATLCDPGLKSRRKVMEEARELQRPFETQLPATRVVDVSSICVVFDSIEHLHRAMTTILENFDVVWLHNAYRSPGCIGQQQLSIGIRQSVQGRDDQDRRTHVSELRLCRQAPPESPGTRGAAESRKHRRQPRKWNELQDLRSEDHEHVRSASAAIRQALQDCGVREADLVSVERRVLQSLDCTDGQVTCRAAQEVDSAVRLADRWGSPADGRESSIAKKTALILREAVELAAAARVPEAQLRRQHAREPPQVAQISGRTDSFVQCVEVHQHGGACYRVGSDHGDEVGPWRLAPGDFIVTVEQFGSPRKGNLGAALAFETAREQTIELAGDGDGSSADRCKAAPRVHRHQSQEGHQIVGLIFDMNGHLTGVETEKAPSTALRP